MAKPTLLVATGGFRVITLPGLGAATKWPMGLGTKALGFDEDGAWLASATHLDGETFDASDGIVTIGGFESGGTVVHKVLVDANGLLLVEHRDRRVKVAVTPAISNAAVYAAKDAIGGLFNFAGAARAGILSGVLESVVIEDKGQQMAQMDLVLFSATFTAPTDNAIFAPTDGELATCIGFVPILTADWKDFSTNSVAMVKPDLRYVLAGTSMYAALVSRGTPTYTSVGDLVVTLTFRTD